MRKARGAVHQGRRVLRREFWKFARRFPTDKSLPSFTAEEGYAAPTQRDPAEDLAYRILAKNGFAPEWVELNKEIGFKIRRWRKALDLAWKRKLEADSGGEAERQDLKWESLLPKFESELQEINQKVVKYNLLVPFGRQLMCYKLEREMRSLREAEQQQSENSSSS